MTLLEWIKANSKDGVTFGDAEKMIKDLEDLNPMNSVKTQDEALAFMERNQIFRSALDSETSRRIDKHDEKFKSDKLPGLLKEERTKIEKEINPDISPEQKRIAELEGREKERDNKDVVTARKEALRLKAAELKYDPLRAERLAIYGDDAEKRLIEEVDYFKTSVNEALELKLKGQYTLTDPTKTQLDPAKLISRADYNNLSVPDRTVFFKDGGKVQD